MEQWLGYQMPEGIMNSPKPVQLFLLSQSVMTIEAADVS
jgi:hypothetical protein